MKKIFNLYILLVSVCFWVNAQDSITDICGNSYPVVTIGTQTWIVENLKCNQYDTESEVKGYIQKYDLINGAISELAQYVDGNNNSLLYNWCAAMGLDESEENSIVVSNFFRQGICPNGFRLPLQEDLENLIKSSDDLSKIKSGTWTSGEGNLNGIRNISSLSLWSSTPEGFDKAVGLTITNDSSYCTNTDWLDFKAVRCIKK